MALCRDVASFTFDQLDRCHLLWRSIVYCRTSKTSHWPVLRTIWLSAFCSSLRIAIAKRPEEGWVMSHMELHFAVRFLIIGIALIYVLGPILWHWRVV